MKTCSTNKFPGILLLLIVFSFPWLSNAVAQQAADSSLNQPGLPDTVDYFSGDLDLNLCTAAFDGNAPVVLELLNKGANKNYSSEGLTPLHYAILNGHLEVARILILNGADLNLPTGDGETPLIMAVHNGQDEITDLLCQNGALLDSTDFYHRTALMYSTADGSFLLTDMLLYYGADPNIGDIDGNDPLIVAVYTNQLNLASDLWKYGANINARDKFKNTALIIAAEKSEPELIDSLLAWGSDPTLKNKAGYTALAKAIISGNTGIVASLIGKHADINERIRTGILPRDLATKNSSLDSLLIIAGAKHSLLPDYREMLIGFDFSSNFNDYMNNVHVGLFDPKFYTSVSIGFHARMSSMKVFVPRTEIEWYQYREQRYFIWAGLDKQFNLLKAENNKRSGIAFGLKGGYTFGSYRGSSANAASEFLLVPSAQVFYGGRYVAVSLGYEYAKYPCFELSAHHLTASINFHFPLHREEKNIKNINWIQTTP